MSETLEGPKAQGLAELIGHEVKIELMPALGVSNYMPDTKLQGFDAVTIEVSDRYGSRGDFIPLMRVLSIAHAQGCRTGDDGRICEGI